MSYTVAINTAHSTYEIKKSVFYGRATFASDRQSAMAFLNDVKLEFPDARHHCWAYLFGDPQSPTSAAMNDDGEPNNTAGKPILNVLQHKEIGDIVIVVARYFGGIRLGAGGLVRAYSTCAQMTMENIKTERRKHIVSFTLTTDFKHEQLIRHFVTSNQGMVENCVYTNFVALSISIPQEHEAKLAAIAGSIGATVRQ